MRNSERKSCLICDRINLIKKGKNKTFIMELKTCYVVFGDHQFYSGYTLVLSKKHEVELHNLSLTERKLFLWEMSVVAEAVHRVFCPKKMNYELLGNAETHLHWHLYPRHRNDPDPTRPIWSYPKEKRCNEKTKISDEFISKYKEKTIYEINRIINKKHTV